MLVKILVLSLAILLWSYAAHAQVGNCPAGTIPNGDQRSPGACVPDPSYNQQQRPSAPPQIWVDHWGAIATGKPGSPPAFGASTDTQSEHAAKAAAVAKCQETANAVCEVHITYRNECVALVFGEKRWKPAADLTKEAATKKSMAECKAYGNSQCELYYSACSYPTRIQ